MKLFKMWSIGY